MRGGLPGRGRSRACASTSSHDSLGNAARISATSADRQVSSLQSLKSIENLLVNLVGGFQAPGFPGGQEVGVHEGSGRQPRPVFIEMPEVFQDFHVARIVGAEPRTVRGTSVPPGRHAG